MKLTGLHFLLTYQCNFECDHCFVWGGPKQKGTFTLDQIRHVLQQAKEVGTVESIYFEGGEPFLYYPILLQAVREAKHFGFEVGLVSNGYWALSVDDAIEWLRPFAGLIDDLSVSSDEYHYDERLSRQARNACAAAEQLGIRFVLQLIGANPASGFATFIYGITGVFVAPFAGLIGTPASGGMTFEVTTLIAMAVYALLFWVIVRVIGIVADRPRARTVTRSTREQTPGGPGNERTTTTISR